MLGWIEDKAYVHDVESLPTLVIAITPDDSIIQEEVNFFQLSPEGQ